MAKMIYVPLNTDKLPSVEITSNIEECGYDEVTILTGPILNQLKDSSVKESIKGFSASTAINNLINFVKENKIDAMLIGGELKNMNYQFLLDILKANENSDRPIRIFQPVEYTRMKYIENGLLEFIKDGFIELYNDDMCKYKLDTIDNKIEKENIDKSITDVEPEPNILRIDFSNTDTLCNSKIDVIEDKIKKFLESEHYNKLEIITKNSHSTVVKNGSNISVSSKFDNDDTIKELCWVKCNNDISMKLIIGKIFQSL